MAPKATSTKPLKQAPISFLTQRASSARSSKAKQGKLSASVTDAPQTTAAISDAVDAVEILAASDIEDAEPTALHAMEDDEVSDDEPEPAAASRNGGGKRAIAPAKKGKGKKEEEDDIEDFEEEKEEEEKPPKKKRRVSARTAKSAAASIEAPSEGDSGAPTKKGKGKQAKGKKSLSKSVFRSREGVENSESNKDTDWATESKNIKISAKGNGTSAVGKHVDIAAMRKHFGYVREKQGNVMPSESPPYRFAVAC